ncbi:DUF2480 family protein [Pontibacter sp. BT310]|uniref:DUF2480 family protein n=1 Tax=Pontibacter populi TaxID=890055 RepID=A0ABS6XF95_9BACT|nr:MULTISPECIES: DUF2480 family protein [Pontibacter]MBJ6119811.1 DUF2480 family protein [Pontibacter sp. BT310]MBR0572240.1 DUF2480 family protein [Microvirga sp. STS03]MBW3366664.1 DUF2480 family protein [Pontibacter populi]
MSELINKVAQSALVTINLEELLHPGERVVYDIKENLFHGLMLREKDFRAFIKENDWTAYDGKNVAIICSADAIVPTWAYMLLATKLQNHANHYVFGDLEALEQSLLKEAIAKIDPEEYREGKVVIKGCGSIPVPTFAYVEIMQKLLPVVSSVMYGEPCSTVPLYKKPKV